MIKPTRTEYVRGEFSEEHVLEDPFDQFSLWWNDAVQASVYMADAMHLATVDQNGHPDVRVVLLKTFGQQGLVFFTNYQSMKAEQMAHHPYAALNFFWREQERQIRVRGKIEKTNREESEEYFHSRPRGAQIGAWASPQSQPIKDRSVIERAFAAKEKEYVGKEIPLPKNWGGFRLVPDYFEFWQGRSNRLHDRICFTRADGGWIKQRLAP